MLALQVKLSWDETPHERLTFMARNFSKDEMEEQDLAAYLASDTDSGDGLYVLLCFTHNETVSVT
jgi:hypothetical protein